MIRNCFLSAKTGIFLGACLLSIVIFNTASGQSGSTSLRGIVSDQAGKPVAGATVTLTNAEKNFSRTQPTNDSGAYLFTAIPPGSYRIDVESGGFKKATVNDIHALVDTPGNLDVQLEVGAVTETVSVSASIEAPLN